MRQSFNERVKRRHRSYVRRTLLWGGTLALCLLALSFVSCQSASPVTKTTNDTARMTSSSGAAETDAKADQKPLAPEIALVDQTGRIHRLSDARGRIVVLNFWSTLCGPCQHEAPLLEAAYARHGENKGDVVILGVVSPLTRDNPQAFEGTKDHVQRYIRDHHLTFPTLFDETGEVLSAWGVRAFPTTFLIGRDGRIIGHVLGGLTAEQIDTIIDRGRKP